MRSFDSLEDPMQIEHAAIWCRDLEAMRAFYVSYFGASPNQKYVNHAKGYQSYFLSFDSGARLELMHMHSIPDPASEPSQQFIGLVRLGREHFANQAFLFLDHRNRLPDADSK